MQQQPHISVCICTYKRLRLLKNLLDDLARQKTRGLFSYSIVVADNDILESAKPVVTQFLASSIVKGVYCVQPEQNIALTRNAALAHAHGDFIAFIDDDQRPIERWLLTLFQICEAHGVDGVLGPVKPHFEVSPPEWVIKGRFFERATYQTGLVIDWPKGRTGNVLLRSKIFSGLDEPFRRNFITGEDQDFFRRMIERGHVFIWCNEAAAFETVPASRWKRTFLLRRALLRGKVALRHPTFGLSDLAKSILAVPLYLFALPFLLLGGQSLFMSYLIRTFDHLGKVLAYLGIDAVKEQYVVE